MNTILESEINDMGFATWSDWEVGVLDFNGNVVMPTGTYVSIFPAGNDQFIVREMGYVGVVDVAGNYIIPLGAYHFINTVNIFGNLSFEIFQRMSWQLLNELQHTSHSGFIADNFNNSFVGLYDTMGNMILPPERYRQILHGPFNGLAVVSSSPNFSNSTRIGLINIYADPY